MRNFLVVLILLSFTHLSFGHTLKPANGDAPLSANNVMYLGNEALSIQLNGLNILFDPFFDENFGTYQSVPNSILANIDAKKGRFANIDVIFISHAHADHFAAKRVMQYLLKNESVRLVASAQAIDMLEALPGFEQVEDRLVKVDLTINDQPISFKMDELSVDVVRIPHSGWPDRADVQNLLFRVVDTQSNKQGYSVMHLGDADAAAHHYLPYKAFFSKRKTNIAFPPYWFFYSMEGRDILSSMLNTEKQIGIHVPNEVPEFLSKEQWPFFHSPGETRNL